MKIVVLDGFTLNPGDLSWDGIAQFGELTVHDRTPADMVLDRSRDAEVIFTNKTPVRAEVIEQLPNLKYIGVLATGYNVVDIVAAMGRGIVVSNIPAYGTMSVAQMTFALLLELCHRVQQHSDSVYAGKWSRSRDFCFWDSPQVELAGKTMGIIGFGAIGQQVGDIATAFGMNILGTARTRRDRSERKNFSWATVEEVLQRSDVVSIHCPLTPETEGLINAKSLKTMKRSAFLVNTSRGPIIVEKDLADALSSGTIAGAAVDVLSVEPPPENNPLLNAPNCIITPHIAWATSEARSRLMEMATENLRQFIAGTPTNVIAK